MTREEAIKRLSNQLNTWESYDPNNQDLREAVDMAIEALKEPERKKGKWLWIGNNCFCGECHRPVYGIIGDYKYCPYCGAKMEGEQ